MPTARHLPWEGKFDTIFVCVVMLASRKLDSVLVLWSACVFAGWLASRLFGELGECAGLPGEERTKG